MWYTFSSEICEIQPISVTWTSKIVILFVYFSDCQIAVHEALAGDT